MYSGGINIIGRGWQRPDDNIGIGCAFLGDGNMGVYNSQVFEIYYRYVFNKYFAATADIQYMKDSMNDGKNTEGWIFGTRFTAEF